MTINLEGLQLISVTGSVSVSAPNTKDPFLKKIIKNKPVCSQAEPEPNHDHLSEPQSDTAYCLLTTVVVWELFQYPPAKEWKKIRSNEKIWYLDG